MSNQTAFPTDNYNLAYLPANRTDEIDLSELIRNLIKEWRLIALITALCALLGGGYALSKTPIYLIETIISSPSVAQMGNVNEQNLIPISQIEAFQRVLTEASKPNIQYNAYLDSELYNVHRNLVESHTFDALQVFQRVSENLSIAKIVYDYTEATDAETTPLENARISLKSSHPAATADYLDTLIAYANREALSTFTTEIEKTQVETVRKLNQQLQVMTQLAEESRQAEIKRLSDANALKIAQIQRKMETLLQAALEAREYSILRYQEALKTARRLEIEEPVVWDDLRPTQHSSQIINEMATEKPETPLYFQGVRILEAEIARLTQREDDRPFIDGYAELAQEINYLENDPKIAALENRADDTIYIESYNELNQQIKTTQKETTVFTGASFSQTSLNPTIPATPATPNRKLIMLAATVLGGFSGLFVALIRIALYKNPDPSIEQSLES